MKTLFLCLIQFYLLRSCTCIFGIAQPRPDHDSSNKLSSGENIFKKCQDVNVNIRKNNYVDTNSLLCFGLEVFSQRSRGGLEESAAFDGAEKKPDNDICKHFQEMRLNSTQDTLDNTVEIYNLLFHNKSSCERACLDIMNNVNPLCNIILLLSRHSEGNPIGSDKKDLSNILSGDNVNRPTDNNDVNEQLRNFGVPGKSLEQKTKGSDVGQVIVPQMPVSNTQEEKILEGQISDTENESVGQNTEIIPPTPSSRGINLPLTDNVGRLDERTQQTDVDVKRKPKTANEGSTIVVERAKEQLSTEVGRLDERTQQTDVDVKRKPKTANEGSTIVVERAKEQLSTDELLKEKVHITPGNNTIKDTVKKSKSSIKELKVSNVEGTQSVDDSNHERKSDSLLPEKAMEPTPVVLPENSDSDKKGKVTATGPKLQENTIAVKDSSTPKKLGTVTDLREGESISQVPNVEEDSIVNGQKSQADNKVTENSPLKEAEIHTNIKMITEVTPNSNTDKQKTNQNSEKAETAPQSHKTDTQKTISDEGPIPDDTDDVSETHPPFSAADKSRTGMYNGAFTNPAGFGEDDDSHFFAYFMTTMVFCIVGYLLFHNKQKILALALEGRARRGRRRPNTSGYRKLDSNLEEAISSSKNTTVTQVIY